MNMPIPRNRSPKRRRGVGRSLCSAFIATTMSVVLALSSVGGGALSAFAATISNDSASQQGAEANAVSGHLAAVVSVGAQIYQQREAEEAAVPQPRSKHVKRRPLAPPSNALLRSVPLVPLPRCRLEPKPSRLQLRPRPRHRRSPLRLRRLRWAKMPAIRTDRHRAIRTLPAPRPSPASSSMTRGPCGLWSQPREHHR